MSTLPQLQLMLAAEFQKQQLREELNPLEIQEAKRQQFVQMRRKQFDFGRFKTDRIQHGKQANRLPKQHLPRKTPSTARR